MKIFKPFLAVVLGLVLFIACQKEYSVEGGNTLGGLAAGSLQDTATSTCYPIVINGTYRQDSTLTDSNFVTVQVNITSPGNYKIFTDAANGFTFRDSGFVAATGLQTFKLKGFGKPTTANPTTFTVTFGTSLCTFTVTVLPSVSAPAAVYTLAGGGSTCTAASVQGTYQVGTPLNTTNKVTLSVNVTTIGSYSISTSLNGMTFSGGGTFTTTGTQPVTLQGSGSPTTAGANTVPVTAGGTTCTFSVTVTAGAVYTLAGAPGSCTGATTQGTYTVGTPLTATNTATISVNVTTTGPYTITTGAVGGMTFAASGTFTATGNQGVVLQGSGTPTTVGANTIPLTAGSSTCSFTVTVLPAGATVPTAADSVWSFNGNPTFYHGSFYDSFDTTLTGPGAGLYFAYDGDKYPTGDTSIFLFVRMTGATIQTGTYTTAAGSGFSLYDSNTGNDFYAADLLTPGSNMTISITSFNATTGAVQGTFSGTAMPVAPNTGAPLVITNGKFMGVMR